MVPGEVSEARLSRLLRRRRANDAACLSWFPSRRHIRVGAVSEGDVADQDPLSRGHRGHAGSVQRKDAGCRQCCDVI